MTYLSNAFSLQMLDLSTEGSIRYQPVSAAEVASALADGFTSAVGHADTARVLSTMLGLPVAAQRINLALGKGDVLYVAQIIGGRLPEGATTLPEGFKIKFIRVTLG